MFNNNLFHMMNTENLDISFIRGILHTNIYNNYNLVMAFATEIVKLSDSLIFNAYNPATRTIEFKIKKSGVKKNKFLPFVYYQNIAIVLHQMICSEWANSICMAIHNNSSGVQSKEYIINMDRYKKICSYDQTFYMLLFNITATTSNGILLQL